LTGTRPPLRRDVFLQRVGGDPINVASIHDLLRHGLDIYGKAMGRRADLAIEEAKRRGGLLAGDQADQL